MTQDAPEIIPVTLAELDAHPDGPGADDPHAYRLAGRPRELFRTNPCARPDDVVQLLARLDGVIAGRMNLLPGEVAAPDAAARIAWGSGYAVHPDARGRGVGGALMRAMDGLYPLLGAIGASAMSEPIFRKLGWTLAEAPRAVFVRRSGPILRAKVRSPAAARAGAAVVNAALRARHAWRLRAPGPAGDLALRPSESVPDAYLPRAPRGPLFFPRTGAWLSWMGAAVPRNEHRRWTVYLADRAGEPFGYVIVSERFHERASRWGYRDLRLATLKDWQAVDASPESNRVLAEAGARAAMTHDAHAVEVCTADPLLLARLRALGAFARGRTTLFLRAPAPPPALAAALADPARWDFRSADGDAFLF